jgi:hypothetical protein
MPAHAGGSSTGGGGLRWRWLLRGWVLGTGTTVFALVLLAHAAQLLDSGERMRSLAGRARRVIHFAWTHS